MCNLPITPGDYLPSICCLITFISYYTIMYAMYSHLTIARKHGLVQIVWSMILMIDQTIWTKPCFVAIVSMTVHSMHDCVIAYESDYVYTIWTKSLITQFALNYALWLQLLHCISSLTVLVQIF